MWLIVSFYVNNLDNNATSIKQRYNHKKNHINLDIVLFFNIFNSLILGLNVKVLLFLINEILVFIVQKNK